MKTPWFQPAPVGNPILPFSALNPPFALLKREIYFLKPTVIYTDGKKEMTGRKRVSSQDSIAFYLAMLSTLSGRRNPGKN
jgi:hypothetical protein